MSTAFVVVIPDQGMPYAILTVPEGLELTREPVVSDVRRACMEITADLNAQASAQYVLSILSKSEEPSPADVVREALAARSGEHDHDHDHDHPHDHEHSED